MGFLAGKKILIVGLASNLSIAWGVAQAMKREGAELAFTYQNEKLKGRVEKMAGELDCNTELIFPCEVTSDEEVSNVFSELGKHWDGLDGLVHSVAFAPREALVGNFLDGITRENFAVANDISSYSLVALAKAGREMLAKNNGSVVAMTYLGAVRVIPNYNLMGVAKASLEANVRYLATALGEQGVRVNAISAGPIRTLAASGISGFRNMLKQFEQSAPLRKCVTTEEVGNTAAFLTSDLASGITGEILYVDAGFNTVAMTGME
ncbi:MAG: enoyl-[acyl-carrier-protein] reductase FabI [Gammaproteobacteria bacterium]|nr:MAG: enoyl-[acyl-carrier-protein] reductase FabI [Gammaproteobacteria bacterium]